MGSPREKNIRVRRASLRIFLQIFIALTFLFVLFYLISPSLESTGSLAISSEFDESAGLQRYDLSDPNSALIAVHVSKTGGTTLDYILQNKIGEKEPGVADLKADCVLEKWMYFTYRTLPIDQRFNYTTCRIVSAEVDSWTLHKWVAEDEIVPSKERKKHFITMLRDPYARLLSQFDHNTHWEKKKMDFCKSLYDVLDDDSLCVKKLKKVTGNIIDKYRNWQVSNVGDIKHLKETFSFFGITEHFYASICLLYYTFNDSKSFDYLCRDKKVPANRIVPKINAKDKRFNFAELNKSNEDLRNRCKETNNGDFDLYSEAVEVFKSRVRKMEEETGLSGLLDIVR
mmetsp:Transcript_3439/g.5353  ORF Transcript_3439/g.5353 Transcript_3439/m.5353 type:complete len:342 (-) Transcript_3439:94-1119(-)